MEGQITMLITLRDAGAEDLMKDPIEMCACLLTIFKKDITKVSFNSSLRVCTWTVSWRHLKWWIRLL